MKKYVALLLVVIMTIAAMPLQALANSPSWDPAQPPGWADGWQPGGAMPRNQAPVSALSNPRMVGVNRTGGNTYQFDLTWLRPPLSPNVDTRGNWGAGTLGESQRIAAGMASDSTWTLHPIRYDVDFRNATENEDWGNSVLPLSWPPTGQFLPQYPLGGNPTVLMPMQTRSFAPSSLYQIRIIPFKYNATRQYILQGSGLIAPVLGRIPAIIDDTPVRRDIIFMSDIEVSTSGTFGRGNSITLEWYNPTFNGMNVFDEWTIAFAPHNPTAPGSFAGETTVRVPFSQVQVLPGGRLRHTFEHRDILPNRQYNVRVEPMIGGQLARRQTEIQMPDGVTYNLAYSDENVLFALPGPVFIAPRLDIEMIGADFARLFWARLDGLNVAHVHLEEWDASLYGTANPFDGNTYIQVWTVISGFDARNTNELLLGPNFPRQIRAFALRIEMDDGTYVRTNLVLYDPTYVDFSPYRPEIINLVAEIVTETSGVLRDLQFRSFVRAPFNQEEDEMARTGAPHAQFNQNLGPNQTPRFIDQNVLYEIFVADSWETLEMLHTPLMVRTPAELMLVPERSLLEVGGPPVYDPTWMLTESISHFYTMVEGEGIVRQTIQGNRVYYVRIRAVRDPGGQTSQWAYGSVFMPPFAGIPTIPEMIAAPPVVIHEETERSIEIRWPMRYLEIKQAMNHPLSDYRDLWHSMVGVTPAGELIYGRSATHIRDAVRYRDQIELDRIYHRLLNDLLPTRELNRLLGIGAQQLWLDLTNPREVSQFLLGPANTAITEFIGNTTPAALRIQNMDGKRYEIHVVEYEYMMRSGALLADPDISPFDHYRDTFLQGTANASAWTSITPTIEDGVARFNITNAHAPNPGGLRPNTAYVIFIRTYEITPAGVKISYFPNFVMGNTQTEIYRPIPDPTTPVLFPVHDLVTDQTIGVRWRVQDSMGFRLRIAERLAEHPGGGVVLTPPLLTQADIDAALADPDVPLWIDYVRVRVGGTQTAPIYDEVPFYFLRIDGLFPGTLYHVWATAYALNEEGMVASPPSQPSNPVDLRTLDITPPRPPGLSPAPTALLDVYNRLNDARYNSQEPNALNLLLTRIIADYQLGTERSDTGTAVGGPVRTIDLPQDVYRRLYIIRFEELIANARYYVRARTVLTVQRGSEGIGSPSIRTYHYEIELADNPDFLDSVTFTIPVAPVVDVTGNLARRAYSPWVEIEVDTGRSDDEHDGVHRPEQFPVPDRDWEITYDSPSQTLRWRFRTNRIGADGRPDQNVDQRFISRLISERTFVYTIDISEFNNFPITNRVVEVPVSIIRAFNERGITLEINTGDMVYSFPPGAFDTSQVRGLQQGLTDFFEINMNKNPQGMPTLVPNTSYAMPPQQLIVTAHNRTRVLTLTTFAQPVSVSLAMDNFIAPGMRESIGLYQTGSGFVGWNNTNAQYSFVTNRLTTQTTRPAIFAGISRNAPPAEGHMTPSANDALARVSSRLTITDMVSFNPAAEVTANQFNNIVNAIVRGNSTVTMNANLPADAARSLTNARLLASANFTREQGIDILVRLYEQRTRQVMTPMTDASAVPGLQNATPALQRNLRIAADIGFITGPLVPHGRMTMGELIHMVDIIIQDAGL